MRILRIGRIDPGQNPQFYVKLFFKFDNLFLKTQPGSSQDYCDFFISCLDICKMTM